MLIFFVGIPDLMLSQEIQIFTVQDFDLKGKVKSCLVSTNYGKEEYVFDEDGHLTKSVTRYNDADYDITIYKYQVGELIEKRFENYRDNSFDKATSIANFYEIDTNTTRKLTEKIVSYDEVFLDQYEYFYDADERLVKIIRTNNEGTDETLIEYSVYKDEQTKTAKLNDVLLESVRSSSRKTKNGNLEKVVLTKRFLEGDPSTAIEEIFDNLNLLVSKTKFSFDDKTKQFTPEEIVKHTYDKKGMLVNTTTNRNEVLESKDFIYQFDNGENGNWIKQIVTPDNAYKTRKIKYYQMENKVKQD